MPTVTPTIAVVTQPTRLEGLLKRRATRGAAAFALQAAREHERVRRGKTKGETSGADVHKAEAAASFAEYAAEDTVYKETLRRLQADLDLGYPITMVARNFLPNFDFGRCALVVVVGQDGLVANTAKYVRDVPIVGVNPDPRRNDGILAPFGADGIRTAAQHALAGQARVTSVTLARVELNDGQSMLAFNDFFVGRRTHVSARYTLRVGGRAEVQSSSGIIVSTGAGSTGWFSSVFNMNRGLARWLKGHPGSPPHLRWEDRQLIWAVREPFASRHSNAELVAGWLNEGDEMVVESLTPEEGVIFSDGVEQDYLEFNSGSIARVGVSSQRARLVVS